MKFEFKKSRVAKLVFLPVMSAIVAPQATLAYDQTHINLRVQELSAQDVGLTELEILLRNEEQLVQTYLEEVDVVKKALRSSKVEGRLQLAGTAANAVVAVLGIGSSFAGMIPLGGLGLLAASSSVGSFQNMSLNYKDAKKLETVVENVHQQLLDAQVALSLVQSAFKNLDPSSKRALSFLAEKRQEAINVEKANLQSLQTALQEAEAKKDTRSLREWATLTQTGGGLALTAYSFYLAYSNRNNPGGFVYALLLLAGAGTSVAGATTLAHDLRYDSRQIRLLESRVQSSLEQIERMERSFETLQVLAN